MFNPFEVWNVGYNLLEHKVGILFLQFELFSTRDCTQIAL